MPSVRILSSTPTTHRPTTLSAIAQKTHDITAQIQLLKIQANRLTSLVKQAPGSGVSKIDWINRQLNKA